VVQLLVKAEADLDLQDQVSWLNPTVKYGIRAVYPVRFIACMRQTGWTALMWAAHRGIAASVTALLQGGASRDIVNSVSAPSRSSASAFLYDISLACSTAREDRGRHGQHSCHWSADC
jgi:hypothetical protein